MTPETLRDTYKRQAEGDLYRKKLDQLIRPKILITPEEIDTAYRLRAGEIHARHILSPQRDPLR